MQAFSGVPVPGFSLTKVAPGSFRADGRRVAIVGGTGGLGQALARFLVSKGARVTVVGRTFRDAGVSGLDFLEADLSLMSEAGRVGAALAAEEFDTLVLTTGIFSTPQRESTPEGVERDLAVSYLSRVRVLRAVAERLGTASTTKRPRVFIMGFPGTGQAGVAEDLNSEVKYEQMTAHMNTVAGNEALVLDAARRYPRLGVFGLNPGLIRTGIRANALGGTKSLRFKVVESIIGFAMVSAEKYAERIAPVLFAPELESVTGIHFNQKARPIQPSAVMTEARVAELMTASDAILSKALATRAA